MTRSNDSVSGNGIAKSREDTIENVRLIDCGCIISDFWHATPGMNEDIYHPVEEAKSDFPIFVGFIATDACRNASTWNSMSINT